MNEHDHMNAHLHGDGSIGYWETCDQYCKDEAAANIQAAKRKAKRAAKGGDGE